MADNHDHFHENGSRVFSDETIRRFLLGKLSATEQPLFEQRLFTDDGLDARVRLAEFDLADDYAFERLSAQERKSFEERFLLTSNRRQKLKVSEALRERPSFIRPTATRAEKNSVADRLRDRFGLGRPAWRIAFGVLILVILLGTAWLVVKEPRIVKKFIPRRSPVASPSPVEPSDAHHPNGAAGPPVHQEKSPPMPPHGPSPAASSNRPRVDSGSVVVSVVLLPDMEPDSFWVRRVDLPRREGTIVQLQLSLKEKPAGAYQAELLTHEGQSVLNANWSQADNAGVPRIDFDVPANWLKPGEYEVRLSRVVAGVRENVGTYYFVVK